MPSSANAFYIAWPYNVPLLQLIAVIIIYTIDRTLNSSPEFRIAIWKLYVR